MAERVGIIGLGITRGKGRRDDVSEVELVNEAVTAALKDAELTIDDIDAVVCGNMEVFEGTLFTDQWLAEGLGSIGKAGVKVNSAGDTGASVFTVGAAHAASGLYKKVLAVGFEKQDEGAYGGIGMRAEETFMDIAGGSGRAFGGMWATAISLLKTGSVTEELIAKLRVKEAEYGRKNPYAHLKLNITEKDVMESEPIMLPMRFLHVCPTSVAASAAILSPESEAKRLSRKPVWVKDYVCYHSGLQPRLGEPFLAASVALPTGPQWRFGVKQAVARLYKRNGITTPRKQLDYVETYAPATWIEADHYETIGLCEPGEAWKLIESEATWAHGDIPVDLSGGVMSTNAIGSTGQQRILECAIQIREEGGERQAHKEVKTAMGFAMGADHFATAVLLSKDL